MAVDNPVLGLIFVKMGLLLKNAFVEWIFSLIEEEYKTT